MVRGRFGRGTLACFWEHGYAMAGRFDSESELYTSMSRRECTGFWDAESVCVSEVVRLYSLTSAYSNAAAAFA